MKLPRSLVFRAFPALLCLFGTELLATDYTIYILDDNEILNGDCSLREAIEAADTDTAIDACAAGSGDDTITLPVGTVIFDSGSHTVSGNHGSLTIQGPALDRELAIVSCGDADRFLQVTGGSVTLRDFSIQECDSNSDQGGAVRAHTASLELINMRFYLNQSPEEGGAVHFDNLAGQPGWLRVEDCLFDSNTAGRASTDSPPRGGGLFASLETSSASIVRTSFVYNHLLSTTDGGYGAGLYIEAHGSSEIELRDLAFEENRCGNFAAGPHLGCGFYADLGAGSSGQIAGVVLSGNYPVAKASVAPTSGAHLRATDSADLTVERILLDGNLVPESTSVSDYQLSVEILDTAFVVVRDVLAVKGQTGLHAVTMGGASPGVRLDHITATENEVGILLAEGSGWIGLQNSIAWGNSGDEMISFGTPALSSNHVGGDDPLFADAAGGDYRLTATSPDRDSGNESLLSVGFCDLAHAPRVVGVHTDKGAFEYGGIFADDFESGDTSAW